MPGQPPCSPSTRRLCLHPSHRLYFKSLAWLRLLFLSLTLGSLPFLVLIRASKFTSPELAARAGAANASWAAPETGVTVYPNVRRPLRDEGASWRCRRLAPHRRSSPPNPRRHHSHTHLGRRSRCLPSPLPPSSTAARTAARWGG
jgi:hypothetical protein